MNRCIVHIGTYKTGSTSIQHSLHGFGDDRFLYARLGDYPNHSLAMYSLFAAQPELHPIHMNDGVDAATVSDYIEKMRTDLEQAISASKGRTLVISGEAISSIKRDGLVKLRDYFRNRFDDLTLVGYVRAPARRMTSAFQQRVQAGATDHFDPDRQYRSYKMTFDKFDEVFGRKRVKLWKFDVESFPERCAVQDFCARLGIDIPPKRIVRLNESLPRHVVALLYTYGKMGPSGTTPMTVLERTRLLDRLKTIGNLPFRLSPELLKPILEKERADIDWMEARLGQTLHEDLGEHQPGDVRDEWDLLRPDPTVTGMLLALLGDSAPAGVKGETPEEVARLVHALREITTEQQKSLRSVITYFGKNVTALLHYLLRHTKIAEARATKKRS